MSSRLFIVACLQSYLGPQRARLVALAMFNSRKWLQ